MVNFSAAHGNRQFADWRTNFFELFLAGVAASRQSAAKQTGAFQMAAFCQKPLHRAKIFYLSTTSIANGSRLGTGLRRSYNPRFLF